MYHVLGPGRPPSATGRAQLLIVRTGLPPLSLSDLFLKHTALRIDSMLRQSTCLFYEQLLPSPKSGSELFQYQFCLINSHMAESVFRTPGLPDFFCGHRTYPALFRFFFISPQAHFHRPSTVHLVIETSNLPIFHVLAPPLERLVNCRFSDPVILV